MVKVCYGMVFRWSFLRFRFCRWIWWGKVGKEGGLKGERKGIIGREGLRERKGREGRREEGRKGKWKKGKKGKEVKGKDRKKDKEGKYIGK